MKKPLEAIFNFLTSIIPFSQERDIAETLSMRVLDGLRLDKGFTT
jgi:hypothetical protein